MRPTMGGRFRSLPVGSLIGCSFQQAAQPPTYMLRWRFAAAGVRGGQDILVDLQPLLPGNIRRIHKARPASTSFDHDITDLQARVANAPGIQENRVRNLHMIGSPRRSRSGQLLGYLLRGWLRRDHPWLGSALA